MVLNQYPLWKYIFIIVILMVGVIYAVPNLYSDDPAVQISPLYGTTMNQNTVDSVQNTLKVLDVNYKSLQQRNHEIVIRFFNSDNQLKAKDKLKNTLGDDYTVTLNSTSTTPQWLTSLIAVPMPVGVALRCGVHLVLQVNMDAVLTQRLQGLMKNFSDALRQANIHYGIILQQQNELAIDFQDANDESSALVLLQKQFPELHFSLQKNNGHFQIIAAWLPERLTDLYQQVMDQTMLILRNRVNALGVAESVVQQQGSDRIAVDLPGIQDTARAEQILGGTATLEFRLLDEQHDPSVAVSTHKVPAGTKLYFWNTQPLLLQDQVVLTGNSITDATASFDDQGQPVVDINLGGGGEAYFHRITGENIGKHLGIVYVETHMQNQIVNGKTVSTPKKVEHVISAPTIQSALPPHFEITGLTNPQEAQDIALQLRAGALPVPIYPVEERTIGPQLGAENIHMGLISIAAGFILAVIFMAIYYRVFGLISNLALAANLILLVAVLSLLGMTLTLPGMAGIVLTLGIAVDANVLIFERIREELRNGMPPQASIHAGYERALATIVDANVTTLIAALVLFAIGTGPVKGFAVTLSLGLLTSMLTGLMFTRAMVNAIFGAKPIKHLPIGI